MILMPIYEISVKYLCCYFRFGLHCQIVHIFISHDIITRSNTFMCFVAKVLGHPVCLSSLRGVISTLDIQLLVLLNWVLSSKGILMGDLCHAKLYIFIICFSPPQARPGAPVSLKTQCLLKNWPLQTEAVVTMLMLSMEMLPTGNQLLVWKLWVHCYGNWPH